MFSLKLVSIKTIVKTPIRFCSKRLVHKTHYEVLELPNNCTTKQIRNAYITLSKKFHPDNNNGQGSHTDFLKISEAYNVLSKPEKRCHYDFELIQNRSARHRPPPRARRGYGYEDESFWRNRYKSHDPHYNEDCYYGIRGVKRISNGFIAGICVLFTVICSGLQFYAIRHTFRLRAELLQKRSRENQEILNKIKSEIEADRELQLQVVEQRLLDDVTFK